MLMSPLLFLCSAVALLIGHGSSRAAFLTTTTRQRPFKQNRHSFVVAPLCSSTVFNNNDSSFQNKTSSADSTSSLQSSDVFFSLNKQSRKTRSQCIPVLSPLLIYDSPLCLLMLGDSHSLSQPTPLQWQTIYESVLIHEEYQKQENNDHNTNHDLTAISAAPVIAVLHSSQTNDGNNNQKTGLRYATLAAVVGISSSESLKERHSPDDVFFVDQRTSIIKPLDSQIRLLAIGRAKVRDFFYKRPMSASSSSSSDDDDDDDDDLDGIMESWSTKDQDPPIVMAEFDLLVDTNERSSSSSSHDDNAKFYSSPVHYINRMATIKNQLCRLHDERRKLVRGCRAAQHRLTFRHEYYEDSDGIGMVTIKSSQKQEGEDDDLSIMYEFLRRYNDVGNADTTRHHSPLSNDDQQQQPHHQDPSLLLSLDNFGLNTYSSMSSLNDLTDVCIQQQLHDYYSTNILQEEEFQMMVFSFICWKSFLGWCSKDDLMWCFTCTNTLERLERAYEIMHQHRELLLKLARQLSHDLVDCGEECDLFW
jgi:hypothetical protein